MSTPKSVTQRAELPLSVPVKAFGLRLTTDATATAAGDPRPSPPVPAKRPTVTILALAALLVVLLTVLAAAVTPRPAQALTPPSYHQIENRQVDSCVTVPTTVFPPKAYLLNCSDQAATLWRLEPNDGFFRIRVLSTDWCLNVGDASHDDGEQIVQHKCVGAANEQWRLDRLGNGYYKIVARHSLKCLDRNGVAVVQHTCHGATPTQTWQQQWRFAVEPTN